MDDQGKNRNLGAVLAEFAGLMAEPHSAEGVLKLLGDYCRELLPVYSVGVLLRRPDGGLEVATAITETGRIVENLEEELHEGPCTDAVSTGEQVSVPDLREALDTYPQFVPRALAGGAQSIHALPLLVRGEPLGAVNLIGQDPVELSASHMATGQLLADVAISYLVNARALAESSKLANQLQHALDSRVVIEQAKGVLSERYGLSLTQAFDRLREHARSQNHKLRDVAAAVLRGELEV